MFSFSLINTPEHFDLDLTRIEGIFQAVGREVDIPQAGSINIAFLSDDEIQTLNREYRGIDSNTDVLSFHYFDDFSELEPTDVAGECILSESRILSQAEEHGHSAREECEILIIHSLLHILGHDHEDDQDFEDMWRHERQLRDQLGLSTTR